MIDLFSRTEQTYCALLHFIFIYAFFLVDAAIFPLKREKRNVVTKMLLEKALFSLA